MKLIYAFFMCFGMFTSIPCPYRPWNEDAREWMTACLPMVGAVIGGLWYALACAANAFLPAMLRAAAIAAIPFLLTGFMHLDGFMDTADAILSWRPLEARQKILKDVHCGSFAVVALALLLIGMLAAAHDVSCERLRALVLIPVASRCLSAFCVRAIPPIGHSEYANLNRSAAAPIAALIMLVFTGMLAQIWLGGWALIAIAATVFGYALSMAHAVKLLKGVSGDLAGYALSVGELCGLVALSIF